MDRDGLLFGCDGEESECFLSSEHSARAWAEGSFAGQKCDWLAYGGNDTESLERKSLQQHWRKIHAEGLKWPKSPSNTFTRVQ